VDWCLLADLSSMLPKAWSIGQAVIAVGLLIFVHELGHFLAAKACGVKCEKFYIGFDIPLRFGRVVLPSALCRFRWGETEYGVGILPLGGYVKMLGQDDNPAGQRRENERIKLPVQAAAPASETPAAPATAGDVATAGPAADAAGPPTSPGTASFVLDPRSYQAKRVGQRMIIISAGVIMNWVFAVVFAALAFGIGISYTPCYIGGTSPGDPAWVAGLGPGDKIIQLGRGARRDERLRFDKDLVPDTFLNGADRDMELLIRRRGQQEPEWFRLRPTARLKDIGRLASLGVRGPGTTKLGAKLPENDPRYRDEGQRRLEEEDEIVAVQGVSLPRNPDIDGIFFHDLEPILAQRTTEPLTLTVQRSPAVKDGTASPSPERFEVTLPATRKRVLGLAVKIGPIVGVRPGTPAEQAGLRVGDLLVSIQDEDVGDPLTLSQRLLPLVGREIEIRVQRDGQAQPVALRITPQPPQAYGHPLEQGALLGLESLGVAVTLQNVVHDVDPDGPAAKAGLRKGDELIKVQFLPVAKDQVEEAQKVQGKDYYRELALNGDLPCWYFFYDGLLQHALPGQSVKLTYRRGGQEETVTLTPVDSERWFVASRGLVFQSLSLTNKAESWTTAVALGLRETKQKSFEVLRILGRLLSWKIPMRSMGGPWAIFDQAAHEASLGLDSLLLFLTYLSANLAVLNLVPIPALDGGHLMFLTAEWIRGKPVDEKLQIRLTAIGIICLLSLMLLVCAFDFHRYLLR
jgi:regulator of sigma E protease